MLQPTTKEWINKAFKRSKEGEPETYAEIIWPRGPELWVLLAVKHSPPVPVAEAICLDMCRNFAEAVQQVAGLMGLN